MTTTWLLGLFGGMSGITLAVATLAGSADLQPMVVTDLAGTLHIEQGMPCAPDVDQTTPVSRGRLEIVPVDGIDVLGGKLFTLTRATVFFTPFSISGSCGPFRVTRNYTEVGVQLTMSVPFTAVAAGGGVYNVRIPKGDVLIFEATLLTSGMETGYKHPSEDVTGTIDLTRGAVTMHVVLATKVHFEAGCTDGRCVIKEDRAGRLTADITGTIHFPDTDRDGIPDRSDNCPFVPNPAQGPVATPVVRPPLNITLHECTDHRIGVAIGADVCFGRPVIVTNDAPTRFAIGPNVVTWMVEDANHHTATATQTVTVVDTAAPTVSCVATNPPGRSFVVTAFDACAPAIIRLGSFVIANGETIQINETGQHGIRLVNDVSADHIRHFQVGKGEAVITATDESSNVGTAICR